MASTIKHKRSTTSGAVPGAGALVEGELAVNVADGKVFVKRSNGSVTNVTADGHGHAIGDVSGLQAALDGKAASSHTHAASAINSGTLDIARIPTGTTSSTVCIGNDSRLSDARTPTSHTHGNITNAGAIGSTSGVPIITGASGVLQAGSFGTAAGSFCQGNDSRLSDARTPTSHTHGNITNAGAIGTTSGVPIITGASGVLQAGQFGTSAGQFAQGNHTHSLSNLSDVIFTTLSSGQVLKYDGTRWVNGTDSTGGGGSVTAEDDQIILAMRVFA